MLNKWLTPQVISICQNVVDWKTAISLCAKPLIDNGSIENRYISKIYELHQTIGPYYVLAPGIAMPHARPEHGVNKMALSLLVVKNGVLFNSAENDPIYLLVLLAAENNNDHIKLISLLAELFSNEQDVEDIISANTIDQITKIINKY